MTGDMRDILERELQLHAAALRGLARDLVGANHADDVVQETALQALRRPPARGGALGGWLAGIVRHVASRHRRADARRVRREQAVAREQVAAGADADDGDTLRFLTDAVLALPQPYRAAVLARYLKDLEPAQIAAQTGEPVATIKTRLKRGLALLRERFDAHEKERGGDWRGALAGAFGLERAAAVASVAGVFAMTAAVKWTFGGVAAAIAIGSLALLVGDAPWSTTPPPANGRERPDLAVAAAPVGLGDETNASSPAARDAVAGAAAAGTQFTIHGRCVDENGAPLLGLAVELGGSKVEGGMGKDFEREYGEWLAARGDQLPLDQTAVTGADGRFDFAAEPSPLSMTLRILRDSIEHTSSLGQVQKAADHDLGDIVIPCGCSLRCRVVDERGRTVATPLVNVVSDHDAKRRAAKRWEVASRIGSVHTDGDGAVSTLVVAGSYRCEVAWLTIVRGESFTVPACTSSWDHEIVVAAPARDETIRGIAVDERGSPLADAAVYGSGDADRPCAARTDATGRFTLLRGGAVDADAVLTASKDGFYFVAKPPRVKWGSDDIRLVLCDAVAIDVRVVDDATGADVTDYTARIWGAPGDPNTSRFGGVNDRASGRHEHGLTHVAGLVPGRHLLIVEPHRREYWRSDAVPFEADATRVNLVEVRLRRAATRPLLVVTQEGKPVPRVRVELIDANAAAPEPVGSGTAACAIATCSGEDVVASRVLLQQVISDRDGGAMLHGPRGRAVVVRIADDAFVPFCIGPITLDELTELVATVPVGATLVARIGPPELVRLLRDLQGSSQRSPGFRLRRGPEREPELVPPKPNGAVLPDADGRLVVSGAPPGDWQLALEPWETDDGRAASLVWDPVPIAAVTLRGGESTELAVDLAAWLPGTITGIVRCNGAIVANAQIGVEVSRPRFDSGKSGRCLTWTNTDADGRFRYTGRAGSIRPFVERSGAGARDARANWVAATESVLSANATVERDFDVVSCPVRVRLLAADGSPLAGEAIVLTTQEAWPRHPFGATDAEGRVAGEAEPGTFLVQVGASRAMVGTVTIVPGAANEFELRR